MLETHKNLILNDFDKSYIMIVYASWYLLMDTASDSLQFFLVLFCDWFGGGGGQVCSLFVWHPLKT